MALGNVIRPMQEELLSEKTGAKKSCATVPLIYDTYIYTCTVCEERLC